MSDLRVELLYTIDCPHWERVRVDLHRVLSEGAIETPIQLVLVGNQDDAEFLEFVGSPTVRVNGEDVVPPPAGMGPGIGCRLYRQPDGTVSGRIPESLLREVIRSHRQGRLEAFQREESAKVAIAALQATADEERAPAQGERATADQECATARGERATADQERAPAGDGGAPAQQED